MVLKLNRCQRSRSESSEWEFKTIEQQRLIMNLPGLDEIGVDFLERLGLEIAPCNAIKTELH